MAIDMHMVLVSGPALPCPVLAACLHLPRAWLYNAVQHRLCIFRRLASNPDSTRCWLCVTSSLALLFLQGQQGAVDKNLHEVKFIH